MSPQEQWEALKDVSPIGSLMAALISVLNLFVVAWWKSQRNTVETECKTQQERHDSAVKELYARIREDGEKHTLALERALAGMREYTDEERHNLREWIQSQIMLTEAHIQQIEKDNRDCEKDRRDLAVLLARKP